MMMKKQGVPSLPKAPISSSLSNSFSKLKVSSDTADVYNTAPSSATLPPNNQQQALPTLSDNGQQQTPLPPELP
jgi:hypothetical protein